MSQAEADHLLGVDEAADLLNAPTRRSTAWVTDAREPSLQFFFAAPMRCQSCSSNVERAFCTSPAADAHLLGRNSTASGISDRPNIRLRVAHSPLGSLDERPAGWKKVSV